MFRNFSINFIIGSKHTSRKVAGIRSYRLLFLVFLHYFSSFKALVSVIKCLDKLLSDFFQEGSDGDGGMRNVNWLISQHPQLSDGLGI